MTARESRLQKKDYSCIQHHINVHILPRASSVAFFLLFSIIIEMETHSTIIRMMSAMAQFDVYQAFYQSYPGENVQYRIIQP
jgi:hypothetical protein